jgi:hypothetical protein
VNAAVQLLKIAAANIRLLVEDAMVDATSNL